MPVFTKEQLTLLRENGKPETHGQDHYPVVKLLLPGTGCNWLLCEMVQKANRLYGYGLSDYGTGSVKHGFIDLLVLELASDPLNLHRVQADTDFISRHRLSVYHKAATLCGGITDDPDDLQQAFNLLQAGECKMLQQPATLKAALQP